ncbi:MAG: outer membrane protein assembly factor BamD [Acidobacteria bacterium]|nr:outer membrane protein assembly factor BamD [Acidobacteriota bacterium]
MLRWRNILALALLAGLLTSCGFRHKKYENPINKDTQQPDKVLYDKAVQDIERSRFEVARITLNTLINTYDTSEYMAKAKLAVADSWFREGGSHGLAQAEAEYKDFILFYPTLEESAEAQEKVCMIHVKQMEKTDRDQKHAMRAEDECRQLLVQFPNSKFAPRAQQLLREIQEVIADSEFKVGLFYHTKGSHPAAANRLQALTDQYPLYSGSDEALWRLGDAYSKMGPRFRDKSGAAYARIVKDYPLSALAGQAKKQLVTMELPVPESDPVAYARMKYELENRTKPSMMSHVWGMFRKSPDVRAAAKSGQPAMTSLRPTIPASIPVPAAGTETGIGADVTVSTVSDSSALDTQPDARMNPPKTEGSAEAQPEPLPTNRQLTPQQKKQIEKQSKKINKK